MWNEKVLWVWMYLYIKEKNENIFGYLFIYLFCWFTWGRGRETQRHATLACVSLAAREDSKVKRRLKGTRTKHPLPNPAISSLPIPSLARTEPILERFKF